MSELINVLKPGGVAIVRENFGKIVFIFKTFLFNFYFYKINKL